jgi:putative ABC transport system substrate-binding protein
VGIFAIALTFIIGGAVARAQQAGKVYRVGYLNNAASIRPVDAAFRKGLQELGYTEGQNLAIEWRFAKGERARFQSLAAELVNLRVDCIVAGGVGLTRAAKQATRTIPIIMSNADDDPVQQGLVGSLARPGGNVTGFTNFGSDLAGKRLELLKEAVPKATRVAILHSSGETAMSHVRETRVVAPALNVQLQSVAVQDAEFLEKAFQIAKSGRAEALIVVHVGLMASLMTQSIGLAAKLRLPAMYSDSQFALSGGLMSYSDDAFDRTRRVAEYVDRILKGTKPADLPVQRPIKFELIINLNAAKQIDLTVQPNVLARADKIIK